MHRELPVFITREPPLATTASSRCLCCAHFFLVGAPANNAGCSGEFEVLCKTFGTLAILQYCNIAILQYCFSGQPGLAHVCPPVLTRSALCCCVDCIRVLQLARQLVRTSRINKTTGAAVPRLDGATPAVCVLAWGLGGGGCGGSAAWRGHAKLRLLRTRKLSRRPPATRRAAGRSLLACFVFGDAARSSPPGLGGASRQRTWPWCVDVPQQCQYSGSSRLIVLDVP